MKELSKAFAPDQVAVATGAASGIGLAAAQRFAAMGMKVVRWHPEHEAEFARYMAGS